MAVTKRGAGGVAREKRREQAAELRKARKSLDEIADILGVSTKTVKRDLDVVIGVWREQAADAIDVFRESEIDEMRKVRDKAWSLLDGSDVEGGKVAPLLQTVIKAGERVAKLHGLDAPEHVILEGRLDVMTSEEARETLAKIPPEFWRTL